MNYLGHLYFSGNDPQLMRANLYGDFIKGSQLELLPDDIRRGVQLHRAIDHYIDHHESVQQLLPVLRPQLPRVASIAVDVYFDHLLARNWELFHPQPLNDYLQVVYRHFRRTDNRFNDAYQQFLQRLLRYNWMAHYPTLDAVDRMCNSISNKLSFPNPLHHGKAVFITHEKAITSAFHEYMRAANEHFLTEELRILS